METRFTPVAVATKFLVLRIMFALCLASICLSERAAAVEFGSNSGARVQESGCPQPEVAACIPTWSSIKPLPVGPGPGMGHGRHVNLNDYGMCGILSLSGVFNNSTFARLIVGENGYYAVYASSTGGPQNVPKVGYTCVHLTDFTGLPPNLDFEVSDAPAVTASGANAPALTAGAASSNTKQIGARADACIWAGVTGGLSESTDLDNIAAETDYVQTAVDWPSLKTEAIAQPTKGVTLSTYAFCNTFRSFVQWTYKLGPAAGCCGAGSTGGTIVDLPVRTGQYWCFMAGVSAPMGQAAAIEPLYAALSVNSAPQPPNEQGVPLYAYSASNAGLYWNCLAFSQNN